jgi:hypothetical protein
VLLPELHAEEGECFDSPCCVRILRNFIARRFPTMERPHTCDCGTDGRKIRSNVVVVDRSAIFPTSHHRRHTVGCRCPFTMKIVAAAFLVSFVVLQCDAFVPTTLRSQSWARSAESKTKGGSSAELGLPCEEECALECFPSLPPTVHPGVLSGQAQIDLLNHAKENGA